MYTTLILFAPKKENSHIALGVEESMLYQMELNQSIGSEKKWTWETTYTSTGNSCKCVRDTGDIKASPLGKKRLNPRYNSRPTCLILQKVKRISVYFFFCSTPSNTSHLNATKPFKAYLCDTMRGCVEILDLAEALQENSCIKVVNRSQGNL